MSEQQIRSLVMREDERGLYVRTREGVLRYHPCGEKHAKSGIRYRVTINYLQDDIGRYDPIPAARCYEINYPFDTYLGDCSWEVQP